MSGEGVTAADGKALGEWARIHLGPHADPVLGVDPPIVTAETPSAELIDLSEAPPGARVHLSNFGAKVARVTLFSSASPPEHIKIESASFLKEIKFDFQGDLKASTDLSLELTNKDRKVSLTGALRFRQLHLRGRAQADTLSNPKELMLQDATLDLGDATWYVEVLALLPSESTNQILASRFGSQRTVLHGEARLGLNNEIALGDLTTTDDQPALLTTPGRVRVQIRSLPDSSHIRMSRGHLELLTSPRPTRPISGLTVVNAESVRVFSHFLTRAIFRSHQDEMLLQLDEGSQVLEVTGPIKLSAEPRTICTGAPGGELVLRRVDNAKGAEIENAHVYELSIGDLAVLAAAERFSPWLPSRRTEALKRERAMTFGLDPQENKEMLDRQRAHYWARMSTILKDSHAAGRTQSDVRYSAMHWRRESSSGRERTLLEVYRLVGYGERFLKPLLAFLILCFLSTPALMEPSPKGLCCDRWKDFVGTFGNLLAAPLSFFRFRDPPLEPSGFVEVSVSIVVQALGLLLIFLSLSAARRVAKAE